MQPLVSIIIPVFNAENTVKDCVKRAFKQNTTKEYEVIVVEDGSTDSTWDILQELKVKYPSLVLLSQNHKGAWAARNKGIKQAKGQYLYFVDADDLMYEDAIETMTHAMEKHPCDLLTFGYMQVNKKKNLEETFSAPFGMFTGAQVRSDYSAWDCNANCKVIGCCWNMLFRKDLVEEHEVCFPELSRNEEEVFILRYLEHVTTIVNIPEVLYEYHPLDSYKAKIVLLDCFGDDVEEFRKIRLEYARKWNCDNEKTRKFIAKEYWGKMMLCLRICKYRNEEELFKTRAQQLRQGLKEIGDVPGFIKKSKIYLLLKTHLYKQVWNAL